MNRYSILGKITAKEGKKEELKKILLDASKLVGKNKDCICYIVSEDLSEENTIRIFEIWESKEAQANVLRTK